MKALIEGLLVVFKHLFRKAVTLEYPEKRRELNEKIIRKSCRFISNDHSGAWNGTERYQGGDRL